jgi:cyclophilin family peptidyl-prolyl cis-trans isomerase
MLRPSPRPALGAALAGALLAATVVSCAAGDAGIPDPPSAPADSQHSDLTDLLTDLADDGSLVAGLGNPDPELRRLAARGLARLPAPDDPSRVLARAGLESDSRVLAELCFAFSRWSLDEAAPSLRKLAGHPASVVRAAAIAALGRLRNDRETTLVLAALDDLHASVRQAAALALADLDGHRYDHRRQADEAAYAARDRALSRAALEDPDAGVRWRAAYALASVRPRSAHVDALERCLDAEREEPLVAAFALRGLAALQSAGLTDAREQARQHVGHADQRVVLEAVAILGAHGGYSELCDLALKHASAPVRRMAWSHLPAARARERGQAAGPNGEPQWPEHLAQLDRDIQEQAELEREPAVKREALAALVGIDAALEDTLGEGWRDALADPAALPEIETRRSGLTLRALRALAGSDNRRDRARAGELLAAGSANDGDLIISLLDDDDPMVRAAVLPVLGSARFASLQPRLADALSSGDPALMGQAATAAAATIDAGEAPPWLVTALADALQACDNFVLEETRIALSETLGLPTLDPLPPPSTPSSSLLQRLAERQSRAAGDPSPLVRMETDRGTVLLRLDRTLAPVHVASFLELAQAGFYDDLDFHRVVTNFVVQGLDPRGDGWGVGARRVPDEQGPRPYLTGTLGMPAAGQPHTGGCQIFITHLPTPHLDGNYTVFGQVVEGMDVVQSLMIGDRVRSVSRIEEG